MIQIVASLSINPDEPEALETYFSVATRLLDKVGAKITQQIEVGDSVVGEKASEIVMLVDYPSYDAIDDVFESEEYTSIIPARDRAFLKYNICIVNNNQLID